ncbi:MAG TPA: DUF63 family protein [Methanocorpusculum sp.]|nr:DUF63 family protein [Methanocorpusculum sp.]
MFEDIYAWMCDIRASNYSVALTIVYAILVILGLYILYRWLKHMKIAIDAPFVLTGITYVVLGGILHVIGDTKLIPDPWEFLMETPQVYILVMIFAILVLWGSIVLERRHIVIKYTTPFMLGGIIPSAIAFLVLVVFGLTGPVGKFDIPVLLIVLLTAAAATAAVWALLRYVFRWKYVTDPVYIALLASHFLDASATGYAISVHPKGYIEQHVLGSGLIELTGTGYIMFALKFVVLVIAIWILEKFRHEEGMSPVWHLVLLAMIVVGLGPGIRDLLRMVLWI